MVDLTYEGIKKCYPHVPIPEKVKGYFQLVRPFTLLPPLTAGIFGTLIALAYYHIFMFWKFYTTIIICASLSLMFMQAFGQVSNQIADVEIDKINKAYRPLPSGILSRNEALILLFVFLGLTLITACFVNPLFLCFSCIGLFVSYAYNFEPLRLKKHLWVNTLGLAFSRGFLPFPMTWSAIGIGVNNPIPWLLGGFAFLWVFFGQNFKDFPDVKGDSEHGIRTLPTVYGVEESLKILQILSLLPFIYLSFIIAVDWVPVKLLILFVLGYFAIVMVTQSNVELRRLENTTSWVCFYVGIILIYILTLLVYL